MKRSTSRILTTHVGSLARPAPLLGFARARQKGEPIDEHAYEDRLRSSVAEVVKRQAQAGIDIVDDGEFGKSTSWSLYALNRLSGFELRPVPPDAPHSLADRQRFIRTRAVVQGAHLRTPMRSVP